MAQNQLMTHLVANFPNPELYKQALEAMLQNNVDYLEIQLPFSHPVADGPTIHQANQIALQFENSLSQIIHEAADTKRQFNTKTELILMSYLTPLVHFGLVEICKLLNKNGFTGLIVPDLVFFSPEHTGMLDLCRKLKLQLIPVISPITTQIRINKIKPFLSENQIIYATARVGQTGKQTVLDKDEILDRLDFLKRNFVNNKIAIGFGIREKSQVDLLNSKGFIAVIGSEIVRIIDSAINQNEDVKKRITDFITNLSN